MSNLPRFFYPGSMAENSIVTLDSDTAKHIWQVLRMKEDDEILLIDGKGTIAEGQIHIAERHKCTVAIQKVSSLPREGNILHLCVGFTKNNSRNEWLLEKATELGVGSITPITTSRSEKTHIRTDRWEKILQSAILQSQQNYLPQLNPSMTLTNVLKHFNNTPGKLIAHCNSEKKRTTISEMLKHVGETVLLIGPEGDFTSDEVTLCEEGGFKAVSLGAQRLRTETAAIAAAAFFNMMSDAKN
jgi:16S rRNA (uracil1498-N3)-methyltransferase